MSHAAARIKADNKVNEALENRIEREEKWSCKFSVTCYAEDKLQNALKSTDRNPKLVNKVKNNIKKAFEDEQFKRDKEKIENLVQQGHLLALAMEEAKDFEWKSYCFGLKKGTLKFILNSTLDILPTKTNLLK